MAERYGRPTVGGTFAVYASIYPDTREHLLRFCAVSGLSTSGAVHHLLRLQLGLPPLRSLHPES